nr:flagellar biosynthesis protein FlgJ [Paracoccus saliphilus]
MQIDSLNPAKMPPLPGVKVANQLEQAFLEEMLKYCGPGAAQGGFSGGAGEEQFASFLTREHAALLAGRLDLGFERILSERPQ